MGARWWCGKQSIECNEIPLSGRTLVASCTVAISPRLIHTTSQISHGNCVWSTYWGPEPEPGAFRKSVELYRQLLGSQDLKPQKCQTIPQTIHTKQNNSLETGLSLLALITAIRWPGAQSSTSSPVSSVTNVFPRASQQYSIVTIFRGGSYCFLAKFWQS